MPTPNRHAPERSVTWPQDYRIAFHGNTVDVGSWVLDVLRYDTAPWRTLPSVGTKELARIVMDTLQHVSSLFVAYAYFEVISLQELDSSSNNEGHRAKCIRSLCAVGAKHNVVPSALFCRNVQYDGINSVAGGGFSVSLCCARANTWRLIRI